MTTTMTSTMYAYHKQIHPPTGIEHSIYCHFYNLTEKNLVIAGASQLKVFRLRPGQEPDSSNVKSTDIPKLKLECTHTFPLFGNIMSMQAVRLVGTFRDALILSFRDAKFSVVEYDPATHDLRTVSLHYFEDDYGMRAGHIQNIQVPIVRVDPDNRCAAMLVYGKNIVILPFKRETTSEETELGPSTSAGGKSPILATYTVNASDVEEKINNIIDFQFLHGYYEPTLLLLYEPVKTWPGRVAVRQDTCAILALSLNIHQKVHPVIWSLTGLPFDCTQVLAIPKPIGGVLVFAINSLLYLNQSVPPYGVSLNSFTDFSTSFPLRPQDNVKISLECAQACFIAYDKLVVSLKGGELYVLTLFNDGMRSIRSFNFDRAAASVLTTCMTACEPNYIFLGSRLGNSLLLHYSEKDPSAVVINALNAANIKLMENYLQDEDEGKEDEPKVTEENGTGEKSEDGDGSERPSKKARLADNMGDWMAGDVALIEDDELEVYGSEDNTVKELTSYTFEVCDSLINIGPCTKVCMGEPAFLSEEFSNNYDPDVELVSTSGFGKNGALSVLQRSVRPQVVTTFELPGCVDMWTVAASVKKDASKDTTVKSQPDNDEDKGDDNINTEGGPSTKAEIINSHAFLILSRMDSSMILQTGQEINELDHSGFSTQASTVFAGNLGDNRYIIQVSPMGVRLLSGVRQTQHIPLDVGSPIVWATVSDPYVLIMSAEGLVIQLILRNDPTTNTGRLAVSRPQLGSAKSRVLTLCLYKDYSGLFTTTPKSEVQVDKPVVAPQVPKPSSIDGVFSKVEDFDEDELLYGSTDPYDDKQDPLLFNEPAKDTNKNYYSNDIKPTYWVFVARENGILEIYSIPDYKLCYLVKNFPMGQRYLVDSVQATTSVDKPSEKQQHESLPILHEILVVALGTNKSRPLLLARVDEDLLLYEAFPFYETQIENHLKLRFRKVNHNMLLRERKTSKMGGANKKPENSEIEKTSDHLRWLRSFTDISGYAGVFVCGAYPFWIFMTSHGEIRGHPMSIDGGVTTFAPFHNVNCPKGFLYFNRQGELRICVLPTHLTYDAPWPVRKVPLRCTPHFVSYHLETKTYCVVTSTVEPCNRMVKFSGEEKEYDILERDERYIYPLVEKFTLQLFSPVSWEMIPNTRIEMEEWEHITCLKNVMLASEGTSSGLKGYIALGTNYNYGEDVTSRGRILILDIIDVVPEPGQPLTKNKIKVIYSKEQKGPVTALCQVVGLLLTAIGQKIYIWQLKDFDLVGVAFIDTQIYIHSAIALKNLILIADICKSVSLLRYQEESRTLSLVSKDVRPMEVYGIDFFIDNSQVGFMVTDSDKNIVIFMYQPEARESFGGQRLLRRGDMHVGSVINCMFRIQCRIGEFINGDRRLLNTLERRQITMYATLDGGLGYFVPVSEKTYRRLLMLQNVLVTNIPHLAGLNPKGFRLHHSQRKILMNPHKNILDGDLLWKFINLSVTEKAEFSRKIGTTTDQVVEDLLEIERITAHY